MKKSVIIALAVGIIAAIGIGAYAHGGGRGWSNFGRGGYGGHMMGGWHSDHMMGSGYGHHSMMGGWETQGGQNYCGGWGWNAPEQSGTAQETLTEEQLKESVQAYVDQYLPGYTIETIEQDQWRPMHYATLKGENGAELQLVVHSFSGQVMHIFAIPAEQPSEE